MNTYKLALAALSLYLAAAPPRASADITPPATQPSVSTAKQPSGPTLDPKIAADVRNSVTHQLFQETEIKGGAFTVEGADSYSPDGVLIGFRLGIGTFFNNDVIKRVDPIYLTPRGAKLGRGFGDEDQTYRTVTAVAPPGFAVGALSIGGGGGLDSIKITFMRFNGTRLDPTDRCVTPTIGMDANNLSQLDGDGTPIIGIRGRLSKDEHFLGMGLIFIKPTAMVVHTDQ
jgi:hypothetical protein